MRHGRFGVYFDVEALDQGVTVEAIETGCSRFLIPHAGLACTAAWRARGARAQILSVLRDGAVYPCRCSVCVCVCTHTHTHLHMVLELSDAQGHVCVCECVCVCVCKIAAERKDRR